jgi:hypothetical protein
MALKDGFGLYVPPWRRWRMSGPYERSEELTPRYQVIAPRADELPPSIRRAVLAEFDRRGPLQWLGDQKGDAPAWLEAITARLIRRNVNVAFDVHETTARAEQLAAISRRERTVPLIARVAAHLAVPMPEGRPDSTEKSIALRCQQPKVWRRVIEKHQTRDAENALREIGFVARRSQLYCSDLAFGWHRGKMRAQLEYLKSHAVESLEGEQLSLFDVHSRSVSNPAIRRTELMTRMSGFEDIAKKNGHVADFWTLTAPSEYHSMLESGGPNPSFGGHSVRDAQAWLAKMWARSRSKLKRLSILVYGFRIAEPHHDGTPHWHMVLFTTPGDQGTLRDVLRRYWLSDRGSEPGAAYHRVKFKAINYAQGSATGYIAKYIAKNIDGFEVGEDLEATTTIERGATVGGLAVAQSPSSSLMVPTPRERRADTPRDGHHHLEQSDTISTAQRVRAWASIHGIRQFQQIGGPPIGLYRELRRCRDAVNVVPIERARVPADAGDWGGYIEAVGGIEAGRQTNISLWTEITGECTQYDELRGPQIMGIRCGAALVATHLQTWRIVQVVAETGFSIEPRRTVIDTGPREERKPEFLDQSTGDFDLWPTLVAPAPL